MAPLTLTATREKVVEMSKPFMQTGIGFIIHKEMGSNDPDLFNFLCPFSTETWVGILVAYLVTGVCIYVATRCEHGSVKPIHVALGGFIQVYSGSLFNSSISVQFNVFLM